jgi:hypothetical protein
MQPLCTRLSSTLHTRRSPLLLSRAASRFRQATQRRARGDTANGSDAPNAAVGQNLASARADPVGTVTNACDGVRRCRRIPPSDLTNPSPQLTRGGGGTGRNVPLGKVGGRRSAPLPSSFVRVASSPNAKRLTEPSSNDGMHDRTAAGPEARLQSPVLWAGRRASRRPLRGRDRLNTG